MTALPSGSIHASIFTQQPAEQLPQPPANNPLDALTLASLVSADRAGRPLAVIGTKHPVLKLRSQLPIGRTHRWPPHRPEHTKRPDLTDKRTKLERVGAILQAGQRVAPFRRWPCGAGLGDGNHLIPVRWPAAPEDGDLSPEKCTTNPVGMGHCAETSPDGVFRTCWSATCASPPRATVRCWTCSATRSSPPVSTSVTCLRIEPVVVAAIEPAWPRRLLSSRPGDCLVVWKLDRLGRSLPHLLTTVTDLKKRGIAFRSLTEQMDTTTPQGEFLFHVFGALAQFERSLIQERVQAGLAAARRRGRRGGRPPAIDAEKLAAVIAALDGGATKAAVCRTFGIKRSTLLDSLARIGWSPGTARCRRHEWRDDSN